ncbi:formate--tetrahydrofolate ligase, partial [Coprococcus sp. MSK.21.13]|nr:formate--tetrahydrofolate ligase [Coprococcus sp. MSK.21.13]
VEVSLNEVWAKGGEGGLDTAKKLIEILENEKADFKPLYDVEASIIEKLNIIVKEMYGADGIVVEKSAMKQIKKIEEIGLDKLPICMAKTQFSFSDDPTLMGAPKGFNITIK